MIGESVERGPLGLHGCALFVPDRVDNGLLVSRWLTPTGAAPRLTHHVTGVAGVDAYCPDGSLEPVTCARSTTTPLFSMAKSTMS